MGRYETVLLDRRDGIAVLTLNRPEAANTLSRQLMEEGVKALDEVRFDENVKVLVITGAGERHFCGGADLRDAGDALAGGKVTMPARDFVNEIERLPQPVVCAINGAAMGGGCEIGLACDLRVMAAEAKIGLTEISFGALPAGGGTQRLPRLVGVGKAKELIYLAKRLTADEALAIGLVNEVVPLADLMGRAEALATEMAQFASYALQTAKQVINEGLKMGLDQGLLMERTVLMKMGTPDERRDAMEKAMARSETYKNIFSGAKS